MTISVSAGYDCVADGSATTESECAALLALVAQGDKAAFGAVYDIAAGHVLGLVRSIMVDRARSEQVAQAALLEIWRCAPRYHSDEAPSALAWMLTVAHRQAVEAVND